jgi:Spy/CpxP family protein refolding chaperone
MTSSIPRRLLTGLFVLGLSSSALATPQGQSRHWWKADDIVKELGLTADQSARIDKIFRSTRPELRQEIEELDRLEAKLSRLIESGTVEEAALARQIDRVETARANANKTRSLMLWRMRQILAPDQRMRLKTIQERTQRERQDRSDPHRQGSGGSKPGE